MDAPAPALAAFSYPETPSRWRRAALVSAAIAGLELVALVVIALAFVARPLADDAASKPAATASATSAEKVTSAAAAATVETSTAALTRAETAVLVLNGNGVSGAASAAAERVRGLRYPVTAVADASRRDFPRTIVMYRPGLRGEALRLARDLGLGAGRAVPLDGLRASQLGGAKLVLVVGG
ncbi:MAG: LytR C-terminal domain-containing protein [Thermoleophilia bacterium]|nr:LytR C-terminal domain-containing protein [Thermoleophilia bacterium]